MSEKKPAGDATIERRRNPANITPLGEWARLRLWQIQPVRDVLGLLAIFGLLWLGYRLSVVTVPLLLAIAVAYLVEPLVRTLTKRGRVSRPGVAIGIIGTITLVVVLPLVLGLAVAVAQGVKYAGAVAQNVTLVQRSIDAPHDAAKREELRAKSKGRLWLNIRDYIVKEQEKRQRAAEPSTEPKTDPPAPDAVPRTLMVDDGKEPSPFYELLMGAMAWAEQNAGSLTSKALQGGAGVIELIVAYVTGTAGRLAGLAFGGFLTAFFFYFICTGWGRVLKFWQGLIPERKQGRVIDLVQQMDRVIAGFVRGRIIICAILMVYYTIGYKLVGVPAWLMLGPIVGVLALIPYAQTAAAPVAMLFMALEPGPGWQSNWWWIVGAPLGLLAIAQFLDDYVLTPRIQGKTTNMDTPTILFASIAGGALAGIYGLLVAIPVAACIRILMREVFWPRFRAWAEGKERDFLPIER